MPPTRDIHMMFDPARSGEGSPDCEQVFVRGSYEYHHYGQNGNDFGWGCAYRSCQTLMSWLELKGVASANGGVPTVKELQTKLVVLGDKPPAFANGTDWIGSVENALLVDAYYGVSSRIINMENRAHQGVTPTVAHQLISHFEQVGSPIMVGGAGGGARTIIGIEFVRAPSSEMLVQRLLVLDPHYSGDDAAPSLEKSMSRICTWADPASLFLQYGEFTNFCLPIPPFPSKAQSGTKEERATGAAASAEDWMGMFEVVESG